MKKHLSFTLTALFLLVAGTGCTEDEYRFRIAEDPGFVDNPVVSVRALDGDRWIEGTLDNESRTVSFEFHVARSLEAIVLDVELEKNWAERYSPADTRFEANLKNDFKFTVSDGIDNISYSVKGSIYQLIKSVSATLGDETVECSRIDNTYSGTFSSAFLLSELKGIDLAVDINEGTELVSDPSIFEDVDFSNGEGLKVVLKDVAADRNRTYVIYANPSNVVELDSQWAEATKTWQSKYNIEFGNMRMYITESLFGYSGNVGYLFTVPAGRVDMKILEKNNLAAGKANMSDQVRSNRDYTLFICEQGPGVYRIDGQTASSGLTYYSPLAYGPDKTGFTKILRNDGWGGSTKAYAPALALNDSKASMELAGTADGVLYKYSDAHGNGAEVWAPEAAMGGYFPIVKDGACLISAEGDRYYNIYNEEWRHLGAGLMTFTYTDWGKCVPILTHDMMRTGRIGVGCTERGDLVILAVEKFVNTHNQGQNVDSGHNGASSDLRGLTLYELAKVMSDMGCSDVMTVEDYNWSYLLLQDGSERGKDVFWTNNRWVIDAKNPSFGTMKAESSEPVNLVMAAFR